MANFNKVMMMGNLTRDPELRYLPNNTPVCQIGLAVNRRFRRSDGEQGEETCFVDCEAFGRPAELINQYCRKGRPLFIEGRLKLDQWQDRDGNNRSKHKIFIENFQFIDSRGNGGDSAGGSYNTESAPAGGQSGSAQPAPPPGQDDDIPF